MKHQVPGWTYRRTLFLVVAAEEMLKDGEVDIFDRKGTVEFYVPDDVDSPIQPSKCSKDNIIWFELPQCL